MRLLNAAGVLSGMKGVVWNLPMELSITYSGGLSSKTIYMVRFHLLGDWQVISFTDKVAALHFIYANRPIIGKATITQRTPVGYSGVIHYIDSILTSN